MQHVNYYYICLCVLLYITFGEMTVLTGYLMLSFFVYRQINLGIWSASGGFGLMLADRFIRGEVSFGVVGPVGQTSCRDDGGLGCVSGHSVNDITSYIYIDSLTQLSC